ncbi:MAG: acetolactate synthase large subunit, partial [Bacteroidales bacterium]|nr:acetolactate synthase large subunit [Bacteroidales bacterium]
IESAAVMINHAEKPMILAGHGVLLSGAEKELLYFAEKSGIPVAVTLLGLSCFPTDHRLYAGLLGMHGNLAPNKMTNEADLIIAVGMRFDDRVTSRVKTYAKNARIIHIEIDPAEINKIVQVDLEINADAKEALKYLTALVDSKSYDSWIREFKLCDKIENETVISKAINPEAGDIRMGEVVSMVSKLTNGEAIVVTDVGQNQMVAARYYDYKIPNSLITSGGMGTMGFGLPAAIGAKVGQPDREVVLFAGDGGLQMTIQELGTILHYGIPVKIVLLNNVWLGMGRQWQEMFFNRRYSSTEMINPDFQLIAQAYSIAYRKVQKREELSEAVAEMVKCEGPFFLEVRVEKEENILPMVPAGATVSDVTLTFESNC